MPALVAWVGIMRWPASSNSNPVSKWSDLLRKTVRWDHWARDFQKDGILAHCSRTFSLSVAGHRPASRRRAAKRSRRQDCGYTAPRTAASRRRDEAMVLVL